MSEKKFKSRIILKHDTESNWSKASFVPRAGEIVIYDIDSNYDYERLKIGDGSAQIGSLPFITDVDSTALNSMIEEVLV